MMDLVELFQSCIVCKTISGILLAALMIITFNNIMRAYKIYKIKKSMDHTIRTIEESYICPVKHP